MICELNSVHEQAWKCIYLNAVELFWKSFLQWSPQYCQLFVLEHFDRSFESGRLLFCNDVNAEPTRKSLFLAFLRFVVVKSRT